MNTQELASLEDRILALVRGNDDHLDSLLQEAAEIMEEEQFNLLCDKALQVMREEVRECTNWQNESEQTP